LALFTFIPIFFIHAILFFISSFKLSIYFKDLFFENYFLLKQDADVDENLTLFYE